MEFPNDICMNGMNISFAKKIAEICEEIRFFYGIEESVRVPINENQLEEFLYDFSAFLLELECPHEDFSSGDILSRFESPSKCELLLKFLMSEQKSARLFALKNLESKELINENRDLELTPIITSALEAVKVPKPTGSTKEYQILESLRQKVDQKIGQSKRSPILKSSLDEKSLQEIEKLCDLFSRDFYNRLLLLTRRLKVTVESFTWCDRLNSKEAEIRQILTKSLKEIEGEKSNCDIAHLLSAGTSLLYIVKASSMENRTRTKSRQHPLSNGEAPKDRGGRTDDMIGLKNESFFQQKSQRNGSSWRGKERRGEHRRNSRGFQQSHQDAVIQQTIKSNEGFGDQKNNYQSRGGYNKGRESNNRRGRGYHNN